MVVVVGLTAALAGYKLWREQGAFTARAGIRDLQPGQYLDEGAAITTLQGVGGARYVDFTLPQAALLASGATVQVEGAGLPAGGVAGPNVCLIRRRTLNRQAYGGASPAAVSGSARSRVGFHGQSRRRRQLR